MNSTRSDLNEALRWHQQGDLDRAEVAYLQILKTQPDNADLLHLLGILYSQQKQYEHALPFLEEALKQDPNSATFNNSMGNVQKKLGHTKEAIQHYQTALKINPNSISAYNNLASIYANEKKWDLAIDYYSKALALDNNFIDTHFNLSLLYLQLDNFQQAKHELERVIELDPHHSFALAHLGKIAMQEQNYIQAKTLLEQSLSQFPDNVDAQVNLGATKVKLGELNLAIDHFEHALKIDPKHFEAHYNLGCTFLNLHQPKDALEHFLLLLSDKPHPDVYYNIGVIYLYQDHHSDAITYLQEAVRLDSQYLEAYINLGVTYLKMQHIAKAIEYFEKALKIKPNNAEVEYILAALRGEQKPTRAPQQYIQHLFDQYAPHYDVHLKKFLQYQTPQQLLDVVSAALAEQLNNLTIVDLGCGTGLTGEVFKPFAKRLVGIDISSKMIEVASKKNLYDDLHIADIHITLNNEHDIDLIVAGDVLSYLGDLNQTFLRVRKSLKNKGYFAFSVERNVDPTIDYHLEPTARFSHSKEYINKLCKEHNMPIIQEALVTLRHQHNQNVMGWLIVCQKEENT